MTKPTAREAPRPAGSPDAAAERQRELQREQDRKDEARALEGSGGKSSKAVQAGLRPQPEVFPAQHLAKPGLESQMDLKPRFMAPDYKGSEK